MIHFLKAGMQMLLTSSFLSFSHTYHKSLIKYMLAAKDFQHDLYSYITIHNYYSRYAEKAKLELDLRQDTWDKWRKHLFHEFYISMSRCMLQMCSTPNALSSPYIFFFFVQTCPADTQSSLTNPFDSPQSHFHL